MPQTRDEQPVKPDEEAVFRSVKHYQLCGLCENSAQPISVRGSDTRPYFLCERCMLISVARGFWPSADEARARYELHNNTLENEGYVAFLNRVLTPMLKYIRPGMRGLDYGCGPAPILSALARRFGIKCENYDPLFSPKQPHPPFDIIFCTETFEHFFEPRHEIERLSAMLSPGGHLGIMTELWDSLKRFKQWYYTRDFTHVAFYHQRTFNYICGEYGFEKMFDDGRRVLILRKAR